uniref:lysozyme n=1 Tax=Ascaris lumbricoides TaxID=6252 RepID=A0A0M3ILG9_ASCLU
MIAVYNTLVLAVSFIPTVICLLMFPQVEFTNDCMRAMCEADSGCVPKGCSEDMYGRLGCGYFRLNIYQYKQCYQPGREDDQDEDEAWIACAENYECSQECLRVSH